MDLQVLLAEVPPKTNKLSPVSPPAEGGREVTEPTIKREIV